MEKRKVLLAEDDEDDRILFADFINESKDFTLLHTVENGVELIAYLESLPDDADLPDLIVLDQNMPKMTGSQTLHLIKKQSRFAKVAIALYSTYTDKRLMDECYIAGALTVVTKPISPGGYLQMLNDLGNLIRN